jgi:uncharacterized protein YbjT (DUF2867 family)
MTEPYRILDLTIQNVCRTVDRRIHSDRGETEESTMILVTGATGNVGSEAVRLLRQQQAPVRALVRSPEKAKALADAGAEVVEGNLTEPADLDRALAGITEVILVSPAVPVQELNVVDAAVRAGVRHIVKITSKASADSPIARRRGQSEIEAGLAAAGIPHTLLRANAYMQNVLALAPAIARTSSFASAAGDGRIGMIDARDVAAVAATIAAAPAGHEGRTYWLTGPALITYADIAATLTDLLGRPITFHTQTFDDNRQAMITAGLPEPIATMNAQAFALIADGDAAWLSDDVPALLGRPARSFAEFAADQFPADR